MNIQKLMKQAQQMQAGLAAKQEELAMQTVEASVGGGKVNVLATCAGDAATASASRIALRMRRYRSPVASVAPPSRSLTVTGGSAPSRRCAPMSPRR